jgi:hypothetical protein
MPPVCTPTHSMNLYGEKHEKELAFLFGQLLLRYIDVETFVRIMCIPSLTELITYCASFFTSG